MLLGLTSQEKRTIIAILFLLFLGISLDFFLKKTNKERLFNYERIEKKLFDKVDINRAGVLEFMNVPGISQDMAKAIVEFRKSQGNFEDIEELKNVKGIKDKKLEKLRKYLKLG